LLYPQGLEAKVRKVLGLSLLLLEGLFLSLEKLEFVQVLPLSLHLMLQASERGLL
jgi:hypothetical protein